MNDAPWYTRKRCPHGARWESCPYTHPPGSGPATVAEYRAASAQPALAAIIQRWGNGDGPEGLAEHLQDLLTGTLHAIEAVTQDRDEAVRALGLALKHFMVESWAPADRDADTLGADSMPGVRIQIEGWGVMT